MAERAFTESQIGQMLKEMWWERDEFLTRLRVRRLLMEMVRDALHDPATGTHVPAIYAKSQLMLVAMIGDVNKAVQNYASRVSANEPQAEVIPISPTRSEVSQSVIKNAAEQERLLMSQWEAVNGRQAQTQVSWSQAWGRAGWYITLPRDASWGLPDRNLYDDLTDDEIEEMSRTGKIRPNKDSNGNFLESADSWMKRRKQAGKDNALSDNARALFTLRAVAPDMVLPRYDDDGSAGRNLKYAIVIEEKPYSDFQPGSELARSAANLDETFDGDISKYGFVVREGRVEGGISSGGEPDSQRGTPWVLATVYTRTEVYYYVTTTRGGAHGKLAYYDEHGAGKVPVVPVPGMYTDSLRPGSEFTSLMEQVFAMTPIINQIETLLSNVATWNGLARFYVVAPDGRIRGNEDGEPLLLTSKDEVPGLDPGQVAQAAGEIKQLTINADLLLKLLQFYTERLDAQMPAPVTEGQAGASAAAWQVRTLLDASGDLLSQAVENHADAVKEVMLLWIRWMRMLDEPLYSFAAPRKRGSRKNLRGLIEFDPKDLTETILVNQNTQSAQQRVVLQQQGVELEREGKITALRMYRDYFLDPDPDQSERDALASEMEKLAIFGASETIQPGSVASDLAMALRGEMTEELFLLSPAFAIASATDMAENAAIAASAEKGNVAEAAGLREPGVGMGITQAPLAPLQSTQ